ncbi:hypothetical protein GWG65_02965 [Bradyrhizobium sp. CSA207]|uniref:hypothetical protein n=1 Tax=Bradyrhizobium sp. CSA207 TaxID=2698826 RepID=UPI0023B206E1|nr:hypothetical protein [Bradyrhizobium sp. CSA207]MDE5440424.1 hypothetical protein [Bradyrhizobium sp. CSA207]
MDIQSWTSTLTLDLSTYDIGIMRLWLRDHAAPVPSTNRDVIGKYLNAHLATNLAWDGLLTSPPRISRPTLRPLREGYEWQEQADGTFTSEPRSRLALAADCFAALSVLACIGLIASHALPCSLHNPFSWYNTAHETPANNTSKASL